MLLTPRFLLVLFAMDFAPQLGETSSGWLMRRRLPGELEQLLTIDGNGYGRTEISVLQAQAFLLVFAKERRRGPADIHHWGFGRYRNRQRIVLSVPSLANTIQTIGAQIAGQVVPAQPLASVLGQLRLLAAGVTGTLHLLSSLLPASSTGMMNATTMPCQDMQALCHYGDTTLIFTNPKLLTPDKARRWS